MPLNCGARLDMRDDLLQSTPPGWACCWGRREMAELLIARGVPLHEPAAEPCHTARLGDGDGPSRYRGVAESPKQV